MSVSGSCVVGVVVLISSVIGVSVRSAISLLPRLSSGGEMPIVYVISAIAVACRIVRTLMFDGSEEQESP